MLLSPCVPVEHILYNTNIFFVTLLNAFQLYLLRVLVLYVNLTTLLDIAAQLKTSDSKSDNFIKSTYIQLK